MREGLRGDGEEIPTAVDFASADGVRQESVVADAHEASREDVEEEALEEVDRRKGQLSRAVAMSPVLPTKREVVTLHADETVVGDRDPVRVPGEIVDHLLGSGHRRLGVNHPVLSRGGTEEFRNLGARGRLECVLSPGILETGEEFSAEDDREDMDGKEEAGLRRDPLLAGGGRAAAGGDDMNVRMVEKTLRPRVKHGGEADPGSKVLGVLRNLGKRLGCSGEEEVVRKARVGQEDGMEFLRDGEDDVMIFNGEDILLAGLDPSGLVETPTFGAVAIPAGVVPDLRIPAGVADLDMAPERRGAAARDRAHSPLLLGREPQKAIPVRAEDVGQLQATGRRPGSVHRYFFGGTCRGRPGS
jgi:hypothetical protein